MEVTIGIILLIVAIIGLIGVINMIDSGSRREQGLPKKERKRLRGKKNGGKHGG